MTKIYACLLGEWVCLNDDQDCKIIDYSKSPDLWWKEGAPLWSPLCRENDLEHTFYGLDYIKIYYKGKTYRIHPIHIQIVTE